MGIFLPMSLKLSAVWLLVTLFCLQDCATSLKSCTKLVSLQEDTEHSYKKVCSLTSTYKHFVWCAIVIYSLLLYELQISKSRFRPPRFRKENFHVEHRQVIRIYSISEICTQNYNQVSTENSDWMWDKVLRLLLDLTLLVKLFQPKYCIILAFTTTSK